MSDSSLDSDFIGLGFDVVVDVTSSGAFEREMDVFNVLARRHIANLPQILKVRLQFLN